MAEAPFITIELWGESSRTGECPMCDQERRLDHAVAWYCGPVRVEIGEHVPGWKGEAIAGGMPVCKACHDGFYYGKGGNG